MILQAILDYASIKNKRNKLYNWIFLPNKHFQHICRSARLRATEVRAQTIQIIKYIFEKKYSILDMYKDV